MDDEHTIGTRHPAAMPWRYRRPAQAEIVEWGDVRGCHVALPTHFHDEDQVTFVLAGRRRFRVGNEIFVIGAGEGVALPAGTPHGSLDEPGGVVCCNAYLRAGHYALADLVGDLARLWRRQGAVRGAFDGPAFADLLRDHRVVPSMAPPLGPSVHSRVGRAAAAAGMSREGFSRAFRRIHGLPPQAFAAMARLNAARALLRAGLPPAAVAAETGFADQSHLGRRFRHAFGVTPGRYRAG